MSTTPPEWSVYIQSQDPGVRGANRSYSKEVRIGRAEECEIQVAAEMVSRVHARIVFEDGRWWIDDCESTNGTFHEGEAIDRCPVLEDMEVQFGEDGPHIYVSVPGQPDNTVSPKEKTSFEKKPSPGKECTRTEGLSDQPVLDSSISDTSVTRYIQHYFDSEGEDVGEHTRMIRKAYQKAQARQRRKYLGILAGVLVLCILLSGYALIQHFQNNQLQEEAKQVWAGMKRQEVLIAQLKQSVEASSNTTLKKRLDALEREREQQETRYRGYVEELGLRRDLTQKEEEIYRVARLFGESEFSIPAGFVRKVKKKIRTYWTGPARDGFLNAIRRAEENGYTSFIVKTLQKHNLPPELFYLALQESRFKRMAVGPRTRWGIAKGMWQFIPKTARKYDLQLGPRVDQRVPDPQDERHNFKASTRAAANYLQTIYSTRAQASGLLVVASYNWGEHRVVPKMEQFPGPQHIPKQAVEGIPDSPARRNYWQFLTTYRERMPAETKDYVLKIFSAAVIGQAPELFGFSFENPLREHLEVSSNPQTVSTTSDINGHQGFTSGASPE